MKKHLESAEQNESKKESAKTVEKKENTSGASVGDLLAQLMYKLFGFFTGSKGTLAGTIAAMLLGVIAFLFTPFEKKIYHMMWGEKVEIRVGPSPLSVVVGKPFDVQPSIINKGSIDVGEGDFRVMYDKRKNFKEVSGNTTAHTDVVQTSYPLKDKLNLRLATVNIGEFPIAFEFTTSQGHYVDTLWIKSEDTYGDVTSVNWSGGWSGSLGGDALKINWVESKEKGNLHSQIGEYVILDRGESGSVKGVRDGSKFNGDFFKAPSETIKWSIVDANFNEITDRPNKYIEIKGVAIQKIKKEGSTKWENTELEPQEFYLQAPIEF